MSARLFRLGAYLLLLGAASLLVQQIWFPGFEGGATAARYGFLLGAGLFVLGAVLWLLEKAGVVVTQRRCVRCGHPVMKGHVYCADHLQQAINEARDKMHGQRGMGV